MWSNLPKTAVEEHYFSGTAGIFRDGHNGTKLTGRDGTHVWSRMSTVRLVPSRPGGTKIGGILRDGTIKLFSGTGTGPNLKTG